MVFRLLLKAVYVPVKQFSATASPVLKKLFCNIYDRPMTLKQLLGVQRSSDEFATSQMKNFFKMEIWLLILEHYSWQLVRRSISVDSTNWCGHVCSPQFNPGEAGSVYVGAGAGKVVLRKGE